VSTLTQNTYVAPNLLINELQIVRAKGSEEARRLEAAKKVEEARQIEDAYLAWKWKCL